MSVWEISPESNLIGRSGEEKAQGLWVKQEGHLAHSQIEFKHIATLQTHLLS